VHKVDLLQEFAQFTEQWQPKVVAELNEQRVKIAKLQGIFVWHAHADEANLLLVVEGRLRMQFRDGEVVLEAGELIVVPAGVEHRPVAEDECWVMLLTPKSATSSSPQDACMVERLDLL
jgi:quercetin dioxygenase-like cupin family protein